MTKRTKQIILVLIMVLCISVPVMSIFIDFGGGTDDAASGIVQSITGQEQVLDAPAIGFEPSEGLEPWMFVLQVLIGVIIFIFAFRALKKQDKSSRVED